MDQGFYILFFLYIIILRNPKLSLAPNPKSQSILHNNNI